MTAYWGILILRALLRTIPEPVGRALGSRAGQAAYFLDFRHRRIALKNLAGALGRETTPAQRRRIARLSFGFLGESLFRLLQADKFLAGTWRERFRLHGLAHLEKAREEGRGIIFVLAHLDAWEYLALIPRLLNFRGAAVAQEIKNPALDGLLRDIREKMGLEIFGKHEVASALLDFLAGGGAIAILADQRAREMSVTVPFFNQPASTTAAPALLAARSGAALIPVFIESSGRDFSVTFLPEVESANRGGVGNRVKAVTAVITLIIEKQIRKNPERWLWAHRRWKPAEAGG